MSTQQTQVGGAGNQSLDQRAGQKHRLGVLRVPRKLAKITAPIAGLRVVEPPREIEAFPYFIAWHSRLSTEPAHAWFRDQVRAAARSIRSK